MSDQIPDPTAWSDDQLDDLLDALAERAQQRDDLDLPGSGMTRRTAIASLLGVGGLGVGASQLASGASWGSASGTLGTQSNPIDTANVRDLDVKTLETQQISNSSASSIAQFDYRLDPGEKRALDPVDNVRASTYIINSTTGKESGIISTDTVGTESVVELTTATGISTTEGNSDSINIYYDSANSRFEIENGFGSIDFPVTVARLGFDSSAAARGL